MSDGRTVMTAESKPTAQPPIFLGTCLRAVRFQLGCDITRLSSFVLVPFFPIRIPDIALVLALPGQFRQAMLDCQLKLTTMRREALLSTIELRTHTVGPVTQEFIVKELQSAPEVILPAKHKSANRRPNRHCREFGMLTRRICCSFFRVPVSRYSSQPKYESTMFATETRSRLECFQLSF
jgi:hypothetical protein